VLRIATSTMVPTALESGGTYAIAIGTPSVGEGAPLVTTPNSLSSSGIEHWSAVPGDRSAVDAHPDELLGRAVARDPFERVAADEI